MMGHTAKLTFGVFVNVEPLQSRLGPTFYHVVYKSIYEYERLPFVSLYDPV